MNRGTKQLYTCWTPLGDLSLDMGPLVLCLGSHRFEQIKNTYGQADVDRDLIAGHFSEDPMEIVDKFGGQWATTHCQRSRGCQFSGLRKIYMFHTRFQIFG